MKIFLVLPALLLGRSLVGEEASFQPPSFQFRDSVYVLQETPNLPSGIFNIYRSGAVQKDAVEVEITVGLMKIADCRKFAEENQAVVSQQRPGSKLLIFSQSDARTAGFAYLSTNPVNGALNGEFWSLERESDLPFSLVKILRIADSSAGARQKMEEGFAEKAAAQLNDLVKTRIPSPRLPFRPISYGGGGVQSAGTVVQVDQPYVEKVFAGPC